MSADFIPSRNTYRTLGSFRFWCQKVLPQVYDDSLSYYELLNKVVDYLNEVNENADGLNADVSAMYNAFEQLQDYVNDWFSDLNVQDEVNAKIQNMVESGEFEELVDTFLEPLFNEYTESTDATISDAISRHDTAISSAISAQNTAIDNAATRLNDRLTQSVSAQNATIASNTSAINVLEGRVNSIANIPSGGTTGDAEVIDIRTAYTGATYPNAGDAVRAQAKDNNSAVVRLNDVVANAFTIGNEISGVNTQTGYKLSNTGVAVSEAQAQIVSYPVTAGDILYVELYEDFLDATYIFQNTMAVTTTAPNLNIIGGILSVYTGSVNGFLKVPDGATHLCVSSNFNNDVNVVKICSEKVLIGTDTTLSVSGKAADAGAVGDYRAENTRVMHQNNYYASMRSALEEYGSITVSPYVLLHGDLGNTSGRPYSPTMMYRMYTNTYFVFPYDIVITCPSDYYFRVYFYNSGEFVRVSSWTRNAPISANNEFRLVIREYPEDTTIDADAVTFGGVVTITYPGYLDGVGSNLYSGEKINLLPSFDKSNRCNIELWKDWTNTNDYWQMYNAQSIEICNGYMFIFTSNAVVDVVDMNSKEVYSTFNIDINLHFNSCQFTDLYYDETDAYPLLMVTYAPICRIYRITQNDTVFNAELVNTLYFPFATYGAVNIVDNARKSMACLYYKNGGYPVYENNPIVMCDYDMPTLDEIKTGVQITYSLVGAKSVVEIAHATMQDAKAYCGKIYMGVTNESESTPRQFIWVFDWTKYAVVSKLRLLNNLEVEGVAINDGTMYVAQRRGANSGNTNPLKIYAITF